MALVSKEEYLKRYLSGSDYEEKKKKKRKKPKESVVKASRMRIVDDDIGLGDIAPKFEEDEEPALYDDEAPVIAGIVDERPEDVIEMEAFRETKRWKTMAQDRNKNGKKTRYDSDSDASPPRRTRHDSDSDQSPPRRNRHDSDSDQSPPRRQRHDSDSDRSPPRRKRQGSDSDQSPPRRKRQDSDSDQSPPRRQRQDSDSDQSPPRRKRHDSNSDQSPPRKHSRSTSDKSLHSHRSRDKSDAQSETKSRRKRPSRFAPQEPEVKQSKDDKGRAKKTLSGLTAGLSTARAMRAENEAKRRREDEMFNQASESVLGRNAATVFRDKETGKKRNLSKENEKTEEENAQKEAMLAKYREWGKGLAQKESQEARLQEALHEVDKPLARFAGDKDMESVLKEQERDGDPMLAYMRKKKQKNAGPAKAQKPRYSGKQPPANRFNLWPGYRWDGVDRSNGFEKSFFMKISERKARDRDAYKWSIEDM